MARSDVVTPAYGAGSLVEVVPSCLAALGAAGWGNALGLPRGSSYVVVLADGLGWNLLLRHESEAPYLSSLASRGRAITCGVPSTTATSLTSLGTGLPPGAHGVVGFTSRVPGTNRLLDALRWDSRVDPLVWQPHETAFERAARAGVPVSVVSRRMFEKSGLTRAGQRGGAYVGADYPGERVVATVAAARRAGSLTYLYDGDLDATGHRHGCDSPAWRMQLEMLDRFLELLRSRLPDECVLVVVADHGMVDVPLDRRVDVVDEPDLRQGVRLFGGEARFRQLYCDDLGGDEVDADADAAADAAAETADAVVRRWSERLGESAVVLTRDQAIDAGWFGSVSAEVRPRIGDVVVASLDDIAVVSRERFPHEAKLLGLHGSLTPDEMLVPLLVDAPGSATAV